MLSQSGLKCSKYNINVPTVFQFSLETTYNFQIRVLTTKNDE